jgi:transcriptional regulator with XRE-family HTH domain
MEILSAVGENIRRLRNEKGLTVTKLAYLVGISYTHLQKIENGKTNVGIATLFSICNSLDIDSST